MNVEGVKKISVVVAGLMVTGSLRSSRMPATT